MDKKTFAQFLLFCTAVLVAWWVASYLWFRPAPGAAPPPQAVPPVAATVEAPHAAPPGEIAPAPPAPRPVAEAPAAEAPQDQPPDEPVPEPVTAGLDNGVLRMRWSTRGAGLTRLDLLDERHKAPYREEGERPVLTLLRDFEQGLYSDVIESVTFYEPGPEGAERSLESSTADRTYELARQGEDGLEFATVLRDLHGHALGVRKSVSIVPGTHHYSVALEFANAGEQPCKFAFALRGPAGIERERLVTTFLGTRVGFSKGRDYSIEKTSPKGLRKGPKTPDPGNYAWAGLVNHYFLAVLDPEDDSWISHVVSRTVTDTDILRASGRWPLGSISKESERPELARQNATVVLHSVPQRLEPGEKLTVRYELIAGPKENDVLRNYNAGLEGLIEYGFLPSVSRLVVALLNGIYRVVPNYGVALIILTIIVRALLHPLTRKSQVGMARMQKLEPMVKELKKKHADDQQKFNQERMALWHKYGVSPMHGCLPMLFQMPVLFALFGALRAAIQLRHAGFLWVDDLSQPDTLFRLRVYLPIVGNEFNLLPLLMAAVMVLTQRSTMKAATEQARQQQKMMKFMPIIFAVFLYHMPSGLCLYILTSTCVGMFERWLVGRHTDRLELKPVGEAARKPKRGSPAARQKPRSGWLGKLQKMLEKQNKAARQPRRKPPKK